MRERPSLSLSQVLTSADSVSNGDTRARTHTKHTVARETSHFLPSEEGKAQGRLVFLANSVSGDRMRYEERDKCSKGTDLSLI